ncbi:MAG TPA: hypothetical protein V6D22_02375 [Candidatus Obscuribacterales bacterium]
MSDKHIDDHLHVPMTHVLVRKRLSLQERLAEDKAPLLFFALILLMGGIFGFVSTPLMLVSAHLGVMFFLLCFTLSLCMGVSALIVARAINRSCIRDNNEIEKLQDELAQGGSSDVVADLHRVIDMHRKQRHYGEAEFYSHRLLAALADAAQGKAMPKVQSTDCWVNTPAYRQTSRYKFVWLFETRGRLMLTADTLSYWSRKVNFTIAIDDIASLTIGRHPWWQKPFPMNYLIVRFWLDGQQHEVHLSPGLQTSTVWDVNKQVADWKRRIEEAIQAHPKAITAEKLQQTG